MRAETQLLLTLALGCAASAGADYMATQICWPGVSVLSSEDLFCGSKYRHYPLANLFDGDPATAWVYKGLPQKQQEYGINTLEIWEGRYAIGFEFSKPIMVDGVEIMNGYNKSRETFYANSRIGEVKVFASEMQPEFAKKRIAKAKLEDWMGWHRVSLPAKKYTAIKLVFDDIVRGPEGDVCVSELRFTYRGKPVDLKMPQAVMETHGSECGCGAQFSAVSRAGKVLALEGGVSEGSTFKFSPDGRFVAGLESKDAKSMTAWIVDLRRGQVTARKRLPWYEEPERVRWQPGKALLDWFDKARKPTAIPLGSS